MGYAHLLTTARKKSLVGVFLRPRGGRGKVIAVLVKHTLCYQAVAIAAGELSTLGR